MKMSSEIYEIYISFLRKNLKLLGFGHYNFSGSRSRSVFPINKQYILRKYENV